jgi:hypothetical protein
MQMKIKNHLLIMSVGMFGVITAEPRTCANILEDMRDLKKMASRSSSQVAPEAEMLISQ